MPGSFDFTGSDTPILHGQAAQIVVAKYNPDAASGKKFSVVPNVQCDMVKEREGLQPSIAQFHYVLDGTNNPDWPQQFEEIFALIDSTASGKKATRRKKYTVQPEDRICVLVYQDAKDENDYQIYFDGFAETPQPSVDGEGQHVTFTASSVAIRLYDSPVYSRMQRDADQPNVEGIETRWLVEDNVVFNEDGLPNCTPDGHDETVDSTDESSTNEYPIFLDNLIKRDPDPRTFWTLEKTARHLLGRFNDEEYVANPDFAVTTALLKNRRPKEGSEFFDESDPSTYEETDIKLGEWDITGKHWPTALEQLLGFYGFAAKYELGTDANGEPDWIIDIYRKDGTGLGDPKELFYQKAGENLDPAKTNTESLSVVRDYKNCYNSVIVDSNTEEVEVSVVLAPGFEPASGDEADANRVNYLKAKLADASGTTRNKYRLYVADEAGDGHWDDDSGDWVPSNPLDLKDIFPEVDGIRTYAIRRRPGKGTLLSKDTANEPYKATLSISRDYAGSSPLLWDGTGTWQNVSGGFEILDDRLGIRLTCEDPEAWKVGLTSGDDPQEHSETIQGVTAQAAPTDGIKRFYLRLTTVIKGDKRAVGRFARRKTSALKYDRTLYTHAKETYGHKVVAAKTQYNTSDDPIEVDLDEETKIKAFAAQVQQAHENPRIAGSVTIPHLDRGYQIGDAISKIKGRNLSLQVNAGSEQGESKRYPLVVGRTWQFSGRQTTTIEVDDHRSNPAW